MRLLQLTTGENELLDLHPNVTVVAGLDDSSHRRLLDAVAGLASSTAVPGGGLLEAHGVLFNLDSALLRVLDVRADDLDPIVRPSHLPSGPTSVDARELKRREQAFALLLEQVAARVEAQARARDAAHAAAVAVEEARRARADGEAGVGHRLEEVDRLTRRLDELIEQRRWAEDQLAEARPALAAAEDARVRVEERTSGIRSARDAATTRRLALETELDAIALAADDPGAADEVMAGAAALREVEAEVATERALDAARVAAAEARTGDDPADQEPVAVRLERAEERLRELDQLLAVLTPTELQVVQEALALLEGDGVELVASTAAHALADELDRIDAEVTIGTERAPEVDAAELAVARARLDDARQALLEAEQAVRSPQIDRDEAMRLEDAHEALLQALDRAERRFSGTRAQERVEQLRVEEQAILDRLGFASYADYVMGHSLLNTDPALEATLATARAELAAAEDEWAELDAATEAALARAATLDRRRTLVAQARDLLGPEHGEIRPQEALRALRVPAVDSSQAAARLRIALDAVGLELGGEDLDHDEIALIAGAWLEEADQAGARRHAAAEERARVEEQRQALAAELAANPPEGDAEPVPDPEVQREARLAEARARLERAQERLRRAEESQGRRDALLDQVAGARAEEESANEHAAGADAELASARDAEEVQREWVQSLDDDLARLADEIADAERSLQSLSVAAPDLGTLDAAIDGAEARHREAIEQLEAAERAVTALDAEGQAAALEIERLQEIVAAQTTGDTTEAEELEWYLLARLAAQRSVSVAGSLPLVLDDALRGLEGADIEHLLGRLERMAEAVQVIVVSDDPLVAAWADQAGPARAAVVRPSAP